MKLDRLLGILTLLLQHDRLTAPYLAEKFEVSRRTIGRDIDTLCRAGVPLITYPGGGGGISIAEGFKLDKSILTAEELASIFAALKGIGTVSENSRMQRTLDKLSAHKEAVISLQQPVVIDLASHYPGSLTKKIEQIKQAIREKRLISFAYYYDKGLVQRCIEPSFVVFQWTAWYVFGYCTLRQDFRMFKLARLWDLRLCDEQYLPREIPPERQDFNAYFADDNKLVALFDPCAKYQLVETYGPDSFCEAPCGRLRLEIGYTNREHMLHWILGFGDKATVLQPADMAKDIRQIAKNLLQNYRE